ncbi:MAG: hypothetical protein ABIT01_07325 [Thermoanaerobaculia bacterium]
MFRRFVAPVLRLLAFIAILMIPLVLAAIAQGSPEPAQPSSLVTLRSVVLGEKIDTRYPQGARLSASAPATLVESRGGRFLVEALPEIASSPVRGWVDATAFVVLDDPSETTQRLLERVQLLVNQGDRPVLAAAYLREALRRDPASIDAWRLLGAVGERLAESSRGTGEGSAPANVSLAVRWGVRLIPSADGKKYRYDGDAFRRLIALSPPAEIAEEARIQLLTKCGIEVDAAHPSDLVAAAIREKDLAEFLASFPSSSRRVSFLVERARLLSALAEGAVRAGAGDVAEAHREAAIEAASEVSSTATDAGRRRTADRLIARLTKSFPRRTENERPVVSPAGFKASFEKRGGRSFLVVTRADGKPAIQPHPVSVPDATTLAFDPTGTKLVWDESPTQGRRRTRLLDLTRAKLIEPGAQAEAELLGTATESAADRYTTFIGFSPDGRSLLIVSEGFTTDGTRIPRRHFLCDSEGGRLPILVERPFSGPNTIDWGRLASADRING